MEKWTYISGGVVLLVDAIFYAIFGRNFTSETFKKRRFEKIKLHNYNLHKFDVSLLEQVKDCLDKKEEEIERLKQNVSD